MLDLWMIVRPVWKIGLSQSLHLHGTTQTSHIESTVPAQVEFKMAAQFQSGRSQCRPKREAALLVTVFIKWICHSSYTLSPAAHYTEMLPLCILKPVIYATASVPVCCAFQ